MVGLRLRRNLRVIQAPFLDNSGDLDEQDGSDSRSRRDARHARKWGRYRPAPALWADLCVVPKRTYLLEAIAIERNRDRNHDRNRDRNAQTGFRCAIDASDACAFSEIAGDFPCASAHQRSELWTIQLGEPRVRI
jgi:hypothetical protein